MAKFVVYADSGGKYRWKLVASNGQTTASSSKSSAKNAAPDPTLDRVSGVRFTAPMHRMANSNAPRVKLMRPRRTRLGMP